MKTPISAEDLDTFVRRSGELYRRVTEGTIPVEQALRNLQSAVEGRVPMRFIRTLSDMILTSGVDDADPRIDACTFPVQVSRFTADRVEPLYLGTAALDVIGQRLQKSKKQFASVEQLVAYEIANDIDADVGEVEHLSALGSFGHDSDGRRCFLSLHYSEGRRQFRLTHLEVEQHHQPLQGEWYHLVCPISS